MKPRCACGGFWQNDTFVHAEACTDRQRSRWKAKFSQPSAKWEVRAGSLRTDTHGKISMTCPHRKVGACGGCFARLHIAMQIIQKEPGAADIIVKEVFDAMNAENAAARLRGEGTF